MHIFLFGGKQNQAVHKADSEHCFVQWLLDSSFQQQAGCCLFPLPTLHLHSYMQGFAATNLLHEKPLLLFACY